MTDRELEVKILEVNKELIEKKLLSLGAVKVFEGIMNSVLFDFSDERIKKAGNVLRIRKEGEKTFVTFKEFLGKANVKSLKETEFEIDSFENAQAIFEALGLKLFRRIKKHRVSYKLNNAKIEFDTHLEDLSFIPTFLEIEANSEEEIYKTAELLGYSKNDCKPFGFGKLLEHYRK